MRRAKAIGPQGIVFFAGGGQQRIQPQALVIIESFVTQGQPIKPLRQQLPHGVIDLYLLTGIPETSGQPLRHPEVGVHLPPEKSTAL